MGLQDKLRSAFPKTVGEIYIKSKIEDSPNETDTAVFSQLSNLTCDEGTRRSRAALLGMIATTNRSLDLTDFSDDCDYRLGLLCLNGIAVELRDLFRILEGLQVLANKEELIMQHITTFYEWFEGFFGIVTCVFDTEEDVLFPWIEKIAALSVENSLALKRRKTKKERTKDLCWDILELKMQFDNNASGKVSLTNLIQEMKDEAEHLGSRILTYMQTVVDELPAILDQNFGFDERRMIEAAVLRNFRATQQGLFVICACSRGIVDNDKRNGFLEESFRVEKSKKSTICKQMKRYHEKHTGLADSLAINDLQIRNATREY